MDALVNRQMNECTYNKSLDAVYAVQLDPVCEQCVWVWCDITRLCQRGMFISVVLFSRSLCLYIEHY